MKLIYHYQHTKSNRLKKGSNKRNQSNYNWPQLEYINENNKTGEFLPSLIGALPIITAASTNAKNLVNAYNNKKANDKLVEERIKKGN
ncbi:MAG: hypothetical protein H9Q67_07335, partial [Spiroplasma ixodetis]|nr:hypothetical protein [Spiroplasma ixodetis]